MFTVYLIVNIKAQNTIASYQNINSSIIYYMHMLYKWSTDMEICNKIEYLMKGLNDEKLQMSSRENKHKIDD